MVSRKETISLSDVHVFLNVAHRLSLTAAADHLGVPKSAVSKAITRLERMLGARLLERSSRRVALTSAGVRLCTRGQALIDDAHALSASIREENKQVAGVVRIAAPPELGTSFIESILPDLLLRFASLRVSVKLGYAFENLLDPEFDLAIRGGEVHDDRLVAHRLGSFRRILVASPRFLARSPVDDLGSLSRSVCLGSSSVEAGVHWTLEGPGGTEEVEVDCRLATNGFTALMHAARAGVGVAQVPQFSAQEWIDRGDVVRVLPDYHSPEVDVFLVHRFGHERIARIAAVLAALRNPAG